MIDLKEASITTIQFFDYTDEDTGCSDYSANIVINERLVVQLSGNSEEAHKVSIPSSAECYYNDEKLQDWACENLNIDLIESLLDKEEIENNYDFLLKNCDEQY